ncbi:MAG TPA: hypothetical protein VM328_07565, partial [Fimbriimonadaceae bacterium]|nr:hypothetical protein [Fimbriimonadaceae bacterium]
MHERAFIRTQSDQLRAGLAKKGLHAPIEEFLRVDEDWRAVRARLDAQRADLNRVSKSIGALMGQGKREEAEAAKVEAKTLSDAIASGEANERDLEGTLREIELQIPNVAHDSVPEGRDESGNRL